VKNRTLNQPIFDPAVLDAGTAAQPDFVYVTGDAFVDHPSFGPAIITRVLLDQGYTVALIVQPDWHSADAFRRFGRPRYAFLVSAGNLDSMVNHYTSSRRPRSEDSYTVGGKAGARPDRACIVYANRCKEAYPGVPVVIGGIEASLRRFAHYDYWDDRVRHSILFDSTADILLYGMGERSIREVAAAFRSGAEVPDMLDIRGACFRVPDGYEDPEALTLPSYQEVASDRKKYAEAFRIQMEEQDPVRGRKLIQPHERGMVLCNPPSMPLSQEEMDAVYALPYTRRPLPDPDADVPALSEVLFSVTSSRGCFGNCNFCALTYHQGRIVQARSQESILREAEELTHRKEFKGYIHDVGGPTANFRHPACSAQLRRGVCRDRQCLGYHACGNVNASHEDYTQLLKRMRKIPGIKKVFVRSGIRFDYLLMDRSDAFLEELVRHHISGQLKVAPEHVSDRVLRCMNKPPFSVYEQFLRRYEEMNRKCGMKQYLVPYLISSHPGSTLEDAVQLAEYIHRTGHRPEQVQDFYPTPGTVSTCMYHTGLDPRTMEPVYVPKSPGEKAMQRALMQFFLPANRALVRKALRLAGREDLIGNGKECLVPEERRDAPRSGNPGTGRLQHDPKPRGGKAAKRPEAEGKRGERGRGKPQGKKPAKGTGKADSARKTSVDKQFRRH
jgi:uncharacterized radical SAM protein YgiQ